MPFLLAAFLGLVLVIAPGCRTTDQTVALLAADLFNTEKAIPSPVGMGDFLVQGRACRLGEEVAAALPSHLLALDPGIQVVSNRNLKAILKEQKLQMKDLFEDTETTAGRLLPAQSLVVGFFFPGDDGEAALEAQILDLSSGEVLSAARARFPDRKAEPLDPFGDLPLEVGFSVLARIRGVRGEMVIRQGEFLHTGDLLKLKLKPNRPAHLYAFLVSSRGEANLLFPEKAGVSARVEGGELFLPASNDYYQLDNQLGKETLLVAASIDPLTDVEDLLAKLDDEADASGLVDIMDRVGTKGIVGISSDDGLSEIMRSYTGVVWLKFDFLHMP
jgi:hypothetical protein